MSPTERSQILIADDNSLNRLVLQELLRKRGYSVHAVNNGTEAIRALESGSFDLLILDCLMPGMDGYTVSRTIRAADRSRLDPEIPIMALTALASEDVRKKCLQAGMDHYICKPFLAETLFQHVEELLRRKSPADSGRPSKDVDKRTGRKPGAPEDEAMSPIASDVFRSMSGRVEKDIVQWQAELEANLERQAYNDIGFLAHKIRGLADLLHWRELSELTARLERAAEAGHDTEVTARVCDVVGSLSRCLKSVSAME